MHKIAIVVIVVGVLLVIGGAVLWKSSGDELEGLADNNRLYEGADSAMELEGWDKNDNYLVVVMEGRYANGRSSIPEGESANLTTEDCNLVSDFTLKDSTGKNFFEPECMIEDDTTEDGLIHAGYICKEGCPDGTYTWKTNGTEIQVYDVGGVIEDLIGGIIGLALSFGTVCCGIIVLVIGIILAFTMQEEDPTHWAAAPGEDVITPKAGRGAGSSWDDNKSGWSEKKDYIRNDEKDGQDP